MISGEPRPEARWKRVGREALLWGRTLASAAVYATLIVTFGFQVARVEGRSMQPALEDHDRLVVFKAGYLVHDPQVGDMVMVLHPHTPSLTLVKRVVAGPGDTVELRDGALVRNGVPVEEAFVSDDVRSHDTLPAVVVPEGFYYVLGDHRNNSTDSRVFGPVPKKYILGRVQLRWWPFGRAMVYEP